MEFREAEATVHCGGDIGGSYAKKRSGNLQQDPESAEFSDILRVKF